MSAFTSTREYDLFGPWIDEVHGDEDVPRLYRDFPVDFANSRLILKVPRNIARRDATPDMDLYDHMLIAGPTALTILSRVSRESPRGARTPSSHTTREIAYADIVALRNVANLLDARLTITSRDGEQMWVDYSGSAAEPITALVDTLRSTFAQRAGTPAAHASQPEPLDERDGAIMVDFSNAARRIPGLTAWAWHDRRTLTPRRRGVGGLARRIALLGSPATLHGAVIGSDATAFEAFGRRESLLRGRAPELSTGRLVIPLASIDSAEVTPHPDYANVATVTFRSGEAHSILHVPEGSPTLAAIERAFVRR